MLQVPYSSYFGVEITCVSHIQIYTSPIPDNPEQRTRLNTWFDWLGKNNPRYSAGSCSIVPYCVLEHVQENGKFDSFARGWKWTPELWFKVLTNFSHCLSARAQILAIFTMFRMLVFDLLIFSQPSSPKVRPSLDIVLSPLRTQIFQFGAVKARWKLDV